MDNKKLTVKDEVTEFLLYSTPNSEIKVEVLLNNETLWLTQKRERIKSKQKKEKRINEKNELKNQN